MSDGVYGSMGLPKRSGEMINCPQHCGQLFQHFVHIGTHIQDTGDAFESAEIAKQWGFCPVLWEKRNRKRQIEFQNAQVIPLFERLDDIDQAIRELRDASAARHPSGATHSKSSEGVERAERVGGISTDWGSSGLGQVVPGRQHGCSDAPNTGLGNTPGALDAPQALRPIDD